MDDKYRKEYLDTLNEIRDYETEYFYTSDNEDEGGMLDVTIRCDINHVYNSCSINLGSVGCHYIHLDTGRRVLFAGEVEVSMNSEKCDEIDQEIEQWFNACNPNKGY